MIETVSLVGLFVLTIMVIAGSGVLLKSRDVLERLVALDLLTVIGVALLALLSYIEAVSFYLDVALALAALSFIAMLAAARSYGRGGPFR